MSRYTLPEGVPTAEVLDRLEARKQALILQQQKDRQDAQEIAQRSAQLPQALAEIENQLQAVQRLMEREQEKAKAEGDMAELHSRVDSLNASVKATIQALTELLESAKLSPKGQVSPTLQPEKFPLALIKADGSQLLVCTYDRLKMEAGKLRQIYGDEYVNQLIETAPKKLTSRG